MGMGFGITVDDVLAVALRRGVHLSDVDADQWFEEIDEDLVEYAAMQANDMDDQTELAHAEIEKQLVELGCFAPAEATKAAEEIASETAPAKSCAPSVRRN